MNLRKVHWCWRKDLAGFRGLADRDRAGFLVLLEWMENFRLRHQLEAGREAAKRFWRAEVLREGVRREEWQLEQWSEAIRWYLEWLKACADAGADHRSLAERVRGAVHGAGARRGLALRTKQCYGAWAARYAGFAGSEEEVMEVAAATRFLESVVVEEGCAYSTQKQALNALAFLFKHVLGIEDPVFGVKLRKTGTRVPVVLSKGETNGLLDELAGSGGRYELPARLQYGSGLRLSELVRLRIKDVDLERGTLTVRQGKGDKDRITVLPKCLQAALAEQIEAAREVWQADREADVAGVYLAPGLARKFRRAAKSFEWFWLFPARRVSVEPASRSYAGTGPASGSCVGTGPESELRRRHHLHAKVHNSAISRAAKKAGIEKRVTSHALSHAYS